MIPHYVHVGWVVAALVVGAGLAWLIFRRAESAMDRAFEACVSLHRENHSNCEEDCEEEMEQIFDEAAADLRDESDDEEP